MSPLISIVMTAYNREHYLGAAIESVLQQTYSNFELLIWDDGSTDRSTEIADRYAEQDQRIRVIAAAQRGRVAALQAAISHTSGAYVGWVDSDDLLAPTALEQTVRVLEDHPETGMVYTDYFEIDEQSNVIRYGHRCSIPYSRERLLVDFMTFHFRLIRRSTFQQVGGLNRSLDYVEDYDLCLRLSEVTEIRRIEQPLYYYRIHSGSVSQQYQLEQMLRSQLVIQRALERRKLDDRYAIEVCVPEGHFYLRPKSSPNPVATLPQKVTKAASLLASLPLLGAVTQLLTSQVAPMRAQSITPAADGTNTIVTPTGNRYNITGGTQAGANLFQSFQQFGLNRGEIANFLANPQIQNILGRVTGGNPSVINGLIQVTGGNPNLFLLNPAGIVFGPNASLNVPAAFTATTATGIGFGNSWFNSIGTNNYSLLTGSPGAFAFTVSQPGAIVNAGSLSVGAGSNLNLLGGTVVNTGQLTAPAGQITVVAAPGGNVIRLTPPGSLLSFDIAPAATANLPNSWNLPIVSLPQLLTGGNLNSASGITVNPNGTVALTGSNIPISNGDVIVRNANAQTATLSADRNSTLVESQLQTTGNLNLLAGDTVLIRDSLRNSFTAKAGGSLSIQGDRGIDILALNHLDQPSFQSGGNINLISDGVISTDAHFTGNGNFSIRNLAGAPAAFTSLYDPVINQAGSYTSGPYLGAALKVQAGGTITFNGDITITGPDATAINDPDSGLLTTSRALILRTSAGNISVGNITTTDPNGSNGGPVILNAPGSITTGNINASARDSNAGLVQSGGNVTLTAGANITTGNIDASYLGGSGYGAQGGNVSLQSGGSILTGAIDTSATTNATFALGTPTYRGGAVDLISGLSPGSNITFNSINTSGIRRVIGSTGVGGNTRIIANGLVQGQAPGTTLITAGTDTSGTIAIQHDGGPNNLPFVVGTATPNGTAGTITRGGSFVITGNNYPVLSNGGSVSPTQGVTITSVNTQPTLTANSALSGATQNTPFTIPYAALAANVSDVNQDNTTLQIIGIAAGATLTRNGSPVVPNVTTISSGDVLVYTPPANAVGNLNAFTLRASDGVSNSNPVAISINVAQRPTVPTNNDNNVPTNITPCILTSCTTIAQQPPSSSVPEAQLNPATPEARFTRDFQAYLGLPNLPIRDNGREVAQEIEQETGAKPAFIYVSFVPQSVDATGVVQFEADENRDDDQLELVLVTAKGNPVRKRIPEAIRAKVLPLAQQFRNEVSDPRKTRATTYLAPSRQLYQWMIEPLAADLQTRGITNLVFIMDTGLRSLPVAALNDGQKFLIETYSVGLMPSLSLTDTRYQGIQGVKVLGMGISESTQDQPPLPAVPTEVSTIVDRLWSGQLLLNSKATLENVKALRQQEPFGIIHLATHADFQPGALNNSYIQFWNEKLRFDQVRQLNLNNPQIELLVLSACATALGDREAELGFGGLAVQAGVKTAIASLWYVNDAATTALMTGFYRNLRTSRIKAQALQQIQIAMAKGQVFIENGRLQGLEPEGIPLPAESLNIRDRQLSHPYYWAAFTMVGNPW